MTDFDKKLARQNKKFQPKISEHDEQKNLFWWATLAASKYPELLLLHAIPNGGLRDEGTARKLKAEGVRAGIPDICLPVARCGFHGLYIELKATGGKATKEQKKWLAELSKQGYKAVICFGFDEAREILEGYLK